MTADDLRQCLAIYRPGLEAEITLLRQLQDLANAEDHVCGAQLSRLAAIAQERERILAALVKIESELRPVRLTIATHRDDAALMDGFTRIAELHKVAAELVATIVHADQHTLKALRAAEAARKLAAQAVGAERSTLAAYRRVVAPPLKGAGLVDRRG
ncbi:MAG: hypothetical protein AB1806_01540 [Acidobacteriota bacterium]